MLQQRGTRGCLQITAALFLSLREVHFQRGFQEFVSVSLRCSPVRQSRRFGSAASLHTLPKAINAHPELVQALMDHGMFSPALSWENREGSKELHELWAL